MVQSCGDSVPKFASFKARNARTDVSRPSDGKRNDRSARSGIKHRAIDEFSRSRNRQRKARSASISSSSKSPVYTSHGFDDDHNNFVVDLRGDPKNVEYGCLHRYSVPLYCRSGHGSVIGAPSNVKIDRELSTEKEIVLSTTRRAEGSQKRISSKKVDASTEDTLERLSAHYDPIQIDEDFVGFEKEEPQHHENKSSKVGVGIWNFIEASDTSDD